MLDLSPRHRLRPVADLSSSRIAFKRAFPGARDTAVVRDNGVCLLHVTGGGRCDGGMPVARYAVTAQYPKSVDSGAGFQCLHALEAVGDVKIPAGVDGDVLRFIEMRCRANPLHVGRRLALPSN